METSKEFDCIVCGSCVVDILVRPLPLNESIVGGRLYEVDPIRLETGGIVSNSGATLAKLGLKVGAFSYVGDDDFGTFIRSRYEKLGINTAGLHTHPTDATSTTAVLVDASGERSFAHCVGAPRKLAASWFEEHLGLFAKSRAVMLGYFSLMPTLEPDLPKVMRMLREQDCLTVMDTAGSGGTLEALAPTLPELDIYIPSYDEACHQTNETKEESILSAYRSCGATGVIGIKLGSKGAVISPADEELIWIDPVQPPGDIIDTTGAGDSFLAGFVAGTLMGLSPAESGRLAASAGACCVTGLGASQGLRDFQQTAELAGLSARIG